MNSVERGSKGLITAITDGNTIFLTFEPVEGKTFSAAIPRDASEGEVIDFIYAIERKTVEARERQLADARAGAGAELEPRQDDQDTGEVPPAPPPDDDSGEA